MFYARTLALLIASVASAGLTTGCAIDGTAQDESDIVQQSFVPGLAANDSAVVSVVENMGGWKAVLRCTGVLVTARYVLTSGQCLRSLRKDTAKEVRVGGLVRALGSFGQTEIDSKGVVIEHGNGADETIAVKGFVFEKIVSLLMRLNWV